MKSLILTALVAAMKAYVGRGLFERIYALVTELMSSQYLTGADKMARVLEVMKQEAADLSTTLIRAAVEVILLKLKG